MWLPFSRCGLRWRKVVTPVARGDQSHDASEALFQTSWFVVSLLTELAVLLVLRTHRPVWNSRPGTWLWITTMFVVALALALPFIPPLAAPFGLVALPAELLGSMLLVVLGYVAATEFAKRRYYAPR